MNKQIHNLRRSGNGVIKPPAYPFSGREIFADLRQRLSEELRLTMTLEQLSAIMGTPISTTHYWLETYPHPHVIGFMSLLEQLSPPQRQAFLEKHIRSLPTLSHPKLKHYPSTQSYLRKILGKQAGISVIAGGTETTRRFLLTAFGHSFPATDLQQRAAVGIDAHRPTEYVPVVGVNYIDGSLGLDHVRTCVGKIWPAVLTSRSPLVLLNRIWSSNPKLHADIINLTRNKHVILADDELPRPSDFRRVRAEVHMLTISKQEHGFGQIRVTCRRKK